MSKLLFKLTLIIRLFPHRQFIKRISPTCFVILISACAAVCQKTVFKGEVIDGRSQERIPGASVIIIGHSHGTVSGEDGKFSMSLPDSFFTSAVVSATGYLPDTLAFSMIKRFNAVYLTPSGKDMEEVVISGTLKEVSRSVSPIPVESYSAKFFKKNVSPTIFEALTVVNGVQPQLNCNVCNTGDIHINGMEGPYTMVLIDGMPIVSNLATVYGFSGIPASLIKRVEVVKGPASTLYGSEAVAGLINIITKDPSSASRFSADLNLTSYQEINADISAKLNFKNATALIGINTFLFDKKFDINNDNFTDVTLQKRMSIFNKWTFERKSKQPMTFATRFLYEDRWGGELQWNRKWRGTDSIYGESIYTKRFELIGHYGLNIPHEKVLLEYSYNYHDQNSYYGKAAFLARQHTAFSQLRWEKTTGRHNLLVGLPFRYTWYDDNTPATTKPDGVVNAAAVNITGGVFVQDEMKWSDDFTSLLGVRYERNSIQGNILSPRLAFRYQKNSNHIFRLSGGNGFRVVNLFTEDHLALSGAREVIITESLRPEKSWNGTFNYTGTFTPSFGYISIEASAFYTHFSNKIVADYDADPQKIIYGNLNGHAVSKGISSNIELSFKKGLKIISGFTLMDVYTVRKVGINTIKERQLFAPKISATYAVSYSLPRYNLSVDFTGKIYGPERLPVVPNDFRPEFSPWFTLANLQVTKRVNNALEIYSGIKNLFNFIPKNPILRPFDPFDREVNDPVNNPQGYTFDPSYNYAPVQRIKAMIGFRYNL